jgi:hypothetical protein
MVWRISRRRPRKRGCSSSWRRPISSPPCYRVPQQFRPQGWMGWEITWFGSPGPGGSVPNEAHARPAPPARTAPPGRAFEDPASRCPTRTGGDAPESQWRGTGRSAGPCSSGEHHRIRRTEARHRRKGGDRAMKKPNMSTMTMTMTCASRPRRATRPALPAAAATPTTLSELRSPPQTGTAPANPPREISHRSVVDGLKPAPNRTGPSRTPRAFPTASSLIDCSPTATSPGPGEAPSGRHPPRRR